MLRRIQIVFAAKYNEHKNRPLVSSDVGRLPRLQTDVLSINDR